MTVLWNEFGWPRWLDGCFVYGLVCSHSANLTLEPVAVPRVAKLAFVLAILDVEARDSRDPPILLIEEFIDAPVGLCMEHIVLVLRLNGERLTLCNGAKRPCFGRHSKYLSINGNNKGSDFLFYSFWLERKFDRKIIGHGTLFHRQIHHSFQLLRPTRHRTIRQRQIRLLRWNAIRRFYSLDSKKRSHDRLALYLCWIQRQDLLLMHLYWWKNDKCKVLLQ